MPEQINQVLRERKVKRKKVENFRKHRILQRYRHLQQTEQPHTQPQDEATSRHLSYYQQVFKQESVPVPRHQPLKQSPAEDHKDLQVLKQRKRGLIKKMKSQKTRKGQPLMRNYIKFALTQLQLTMKQEKKKQGQKKGQGRQEETVAAQIKDRKQRGKPQNGKSR